MTKLLYPTREVKATLGLGTTRLYQLLNAGELKAVRLGHRTYITAASLEAFVGSLKPVLTPTMVRSRRPRANPQQEDEPSGIT
jgi:hypothetical protein